MTKVLRPDEYGDVRRRSCADGFGRVLVLRQNVEKSQALSPSTENCPSWMFGEADFPDNKSPTVSVRRLCLCAVRPDWPTDTTPSPRVAGTVQTHLINGTISFNFMCASETNKALVYIYPADSNIRRVRT